LTLKYYKKLITYKNDVTLRPHLLIWQRGGQKETETGHQWKRDRELEKKELQEVATSDPPIHNFKPLAGAHPIMIQ